MFEPDQLSDLRRRIREQVDQDRGLLDQMIRHVRRMAPDVRTIRPRGATSVALMAADGGHNQVAFNPFFLQVVRIVDSMGKELFLDVVSPTNDIGELSARHHDARTALGRLMRDLDVSDLRELSPMMTGRSPGWVRTYRDLCEWATLYDLICYRDHAGDTLIVRDGLLRSTLFADGLFERMHELITDAIDRINRRDRRRVWLVGLAKQTKVLEHYRLAISLAGVLRPGSPCFVPVPADLQREVYRWAEYVRAPDDTATGTPHAFNMAQMYFARFGERPGDPVWTVDVLLAQAGDAQTVFGHLLADAIDGFPVPLYPASVQRADVHARMADIDVDIIEDDLVEAVRAGLGPELTGVVDMLRMSTDVAARRYA